MEPYISEVEQKVGRNFLLFQRIEIVLKRFLARSYVSGYSHELEARFQERVSSLENQTMGMLTKQFSAQVLTGGEAINSEPEELTGNWISLQLTTENESLKSSLSEIVAERNRLTHHFQLEFDLTTQAGIRAAVDYLDLQHESAQRIWTNLSNVVKTFQEMQQQMAEFFASEAGHIYLLSTHIVELLKAVAWEKARPDDGWTDLSTAGKILTEKAPDELAKVKAAYKQTTLKGLLLATEWGDLLEEPTSKGGVRLLYRMKPEQAWRFLLEPSVPTEAVTVPADSP